MNLALKPLSLFVTVSFVGLFLATVPVWLRDITNIDRLFVVLLMAGLLLAWSAYRHWQTMSC